MPTSEDLFANEDPNIADSITAICEEGVKSLLVAMEAFHVAWLGSETALNGESPNVSESREISECLLNIINRDLEEIEALIFSNIHPFLATEVNQFRIRKLFLTQVDFRHRELEGLINAPNN